MNQNTKNLYALSRIKGLGKVSLSKIRQAGYSSIHDLSTDCNFDELKSFIRAGKNQKIAIDTILHNADSHYDLIEKELDSLLKKNIQIVSVEDQLYPQLYHLINDKPLFIYAKGNLDLLNDENGIAIIGTRNCSDFGANIAFKTAKYFAETNYNIISGLALGIDSAAHKGALAASHGKTTAVLVDVDDVYPKENLDLAENILSNDGLLIAENPPGTFSAGHLFVKRDRLQSGLSLGVFPIETGVKGGTMHTVKFSEDQNRLRFVPDFNSIDGYEAGTDFAKGILKLIREDKAETFTKKDYKVIIEKLNAKRQELNKRLKLDNNQSTQLNVFDS
jgi:DNA processing protein